ncbi:hypothetical protein [Nonomuraea diastatica]|uniref:hypothetical protein n=1 Tax=Nonomuraea diastatica TaxID=1848329 RepID=UPI001C70908F|nr:hypothetical protein [Nonomuraea diastatica]
MLTHAPEKARSIIAGSVPRCGSARCRRPAPPADPPRSSTPPSRQARIVRDFKQAWEAGDIDALITLLDPGATATSDGGGLVSTALHPVEGAEQILRSLVHLKDRLRNLTLVERTVNGQPGLIAQEDGVTVSVYAFEVAGDRIKHIWAVRNPDKLRPWTGGPQP